MKTQSVLFLLGSLLLLQGCSSLYDSRKCDDNVSYSQTQNANACDEGVHYDNLRGD